MLDYREKGEDHHFGPPLSCVEVLLTGDEDVMAGNDAAGTMTVRGPAVIGGELKMETMAKFDVDNTLVLA